MTLLPNPARRRFLVGTAAIGGALLVGCSPKPVDRLGDGSEIHEPKGETALNAWLRIADDGMVTVAIARAEMGQGITTSLPMLVAEELGCAWEMVRFELVVPEAVHGNVKSITDALPFRDDDTAAMTTLIRWFAPHVAGRGQLVTGGSTSVRDAWEPLRIAGAAARYALIRAAAREWGIAPEELSTENGEVLHPDGRTLDYGALADAASRVPMPSSYRLKAPAEFKLLGRSLRRLDIPEKINGTAMFGADVRLPGMLYAASRLCPVAGGTIKSSDEAKVRHLPGVRQVVRSGSVMGSAPGFVVVATDSWTAQQAARQLSVEWNEGVHGAYNSDSESQLLIQKVNEDKGALWYSQGDLSAIEDSGARRFDALYTVPMLAHAAIEPATCTALFETDRRVARLKIWAPTQSPGLFMQAAAKAADLPIDQIVIQPTMIGGGFGYKSLLEPLIQSIAAAKALPDIPVQLLWTREQDLAHDLYRPQAAALTTAWLTGEGKAGRWVGWRHRSASASVIGAMLARSLPSWLARRIPDKTTIEGAYDNPYSMDAQEIHHIKTETTAPIGFWRSVGHSHQAFFVESFIDEIAHQLKQDPLELRLRKLRAAPRDSEVLQVAAREAGWGKTQARGTALGLAVHASFGSCCAQVVQLVRRDDGKIRVERVVCAIDCGFALHPDIIAQQMEGAVVYGLTAALYGKITMKAGRVEQTSFADYRLMSLASAPQVDTFIVPTRATEPGGIGEVALPPVAPALCNALFQLTGKRVRDLPIAHQASFA